MKARNSNGEIKKVVLQANDSIPAGSVIEYDGDVVPEGYEQVEDKTEIKITELEKKINNNTYLSILGSVGDNETKTFPVNSGKVYLYINSHVFQRCIVLITIYNDIIAKDIIYKSSDAAIPTISLNSNELTIESKMQCRGKLIRLNNLICA